MPKSIDIPNQAIKRGWLFYFRTVPVSEANNASEPATDNLLKRKYLHNWHIIRSSSIMLKNYLLIALRNVRKNKVFSLINITGLMLGIGCSLAVFMIVRSELSVDRFHPGHQRIYRVVSDFHYPEGAEYQSGVPYPLPEAMRHEFPQLENVSSILGAYNTLITLPGDQPGQSARKFKEKDGIFYTDPAFFQIFSFHWLYGDPGSVLAAPNTIALARSTAEKYFGSWQNAIGKTIRKDNQESLTVQGIMDDPPANTDFPLKGVISFSTIAKSFQGKSWGSVSSGFQCFILLSAHTSFASINALLPRFRKKYRDNLTDFFSLQPLDEIHFDARYGNFKGRATQRQTLWILSLIGGFILVLGCINFINLSTAQAINRSREVGIRKVLGSRRWQLAMQFLGETALLVLIASLLALGLVILSLPRLGQLLNASLSQQPLDSMENILFIVCAGLAVTLISGFYPAIIISGFRPIAALKNKIVSRNESGALSLRRSLVVTQFVIAQVLIAGVLVAISQMNFFRTAAMGFDRNAVITVPLPRDSASQAGWGAFRQAVLGTAGVENCSLSATAPASKGYNTSTFHFDRHTKNENFEINIKAADTGYFATYGLQLIAGRASRPSDSIREFVVNETFCRKEGFTDPRSVLGKVIAYDDVSAPIVGVVKDFHQHSLRDPIDPAAIVTQRSAYAIAGIRLRAGNLPAALGDIGQLFSQYFPDALFEHQFLDETIAHYYDQEQRLSTIFRFFAVVALVISCLGLYGLILFTTTQRTREVGIRKVLGASVAGISYLFIREFLWLIGIAFVIASPLAWYFMHKWLENFAYRVPISGWIFAATGLTALLIGLVTISFQTLKTALANPVKSLRTSD